MPSRYIASARSVSQDIIPDKRVNALDNPWYILGFQRLILVMDNLGRCEADPHLVKAMLFPRNAYMTPARCKRFCQALHDGGLCFLFSIDAEAYLQSPSYHRQIMSGRMERKSLLPAPDPEEYLTWLVGVRRDKRFEVAGLSVENGQLISSIDRFSADTRNEFEENGQLISSIKQKSADGRNQLDEDEQVQAHELLQNRKLVALQYVRAMLTDCSNVSEVSSDGKVNSLETHSEFTAEEKEKRKRREGKEKEKGSDSDPPHTDPNLQSPLSPRPTLSDSQKEAEFDHVVDSFHAHLSGDLTPQIATAIRKLLADLEPTTIIDAMTTAQNQLGHKPDWPYVKAILNNWLSSRYTRAPGTTSARRAAKRQDEDRDKYIKGRYGHLVHRGPTSDRERGLSPVSADDQSTCGVCGLPLDQCQCLDAQEPTTPDP